MTPERRATLWLTLLCVLWGSSFFSMQLGGAGLETVVGKKAAPSAFLFLRFATAAALFPLVFPGALRALTRGTIRDGLILSVPFYAGFILQVTGLQETTSTVSAFVTNITVVLTPLLGRLLFRERVGWNTLAGGLVALAGVYVLTGAGGGVFGTGELLTAGCAVAFAFQIQLTHVFTRRSPPDAITFVMICAAVVYSAATLAVMGTSPSDLVRALEARHVAWTALYNAVACTVVANTLMNRYQRAIPPTRAAVLYTLEPVFAALFAVLLVAEVMTPAKLAGGAIIIAGNLVCELFRKPA